MKRGRSTLALDRPVFEQLENRLLLSYSGVLVSAVAAGSLVPGEGSGTSPAAYMDPPVTAQADPTTLYYHTTTIQGAFTTYPSTGYPKAVKYDLPDSQLYEVESLGIMSAGREENFPENTNIVIRIWDAGGSPLYTSDPFDWSGESAALALRTMYIDTAHVQVSGSFYGGYQLAAGAPMEFGFKVDVPSGNQYGHSYTYKVSTGTWTAYTSDDIWFDATVRVAEVNEAPTDIDVSDYSVPENQPVGTPVGTFSTTDPDDGDTHTYELVPGPGGEDNDSFTTSGNTLKTAAVFDYEAKNSYSIRVRTTDQGGLWYEEPFTINVTDVNLAPTDISLSATAVPENQPSGTTVGTFSTVDPEAPSAPFTYTLVAGTGSTDNGSFTVSGNTLKTAAVFDYEAKNSYSIRVRSTDQGGLDTEKVFTISVVDLQENWTGDMDDHWENSANWSTGVVPGATDTAVFEQAATYQPALYQDEAITGLDFRTTGWTLSCNSHTLTVGEGGITFAGGGPPTSCVDIGTGNLVCDYAAGASPFDAVSAWIACGCHGRAWDGQGITSSAAAGHPQGLTAVGVIDNSDPEPGIGGLATFGGVAVDETSVLAACTWWGDVNLDGVVDSNDYDRIDTNYVLWTKEGRVPDGGWRWAVGDLDYDKMIDSNDYDLIDNAFVHQGGPAAAGSAASLAGPDLLPLVALSPKAPDLTAWPEVALVAGSSGRQPVAEPANVLPALATFSAASDGPAGEAVTALTAESANLAAPAVWSPLSAHASADADMAAIDSLFDPLALPALDVRL